MALGFATWARRAFRTVPVPWWRCLDDGHRFSSRMLQDDHCCLLSLRIFYESVCLKQRVFPEILADDDDTGKVWKR